MCTVRAYEARALEAIAASCEPCLQEMAPTSLEFWRSGLARDGQPAGAA